MSSSNTQTLKKNKGVSIKNQSTKKKISFFSAILLVIGSSIGAGIFLKNGEILRNVTGSGSIGMALAIVLSMISWIIAIVGVMAMGLTLTELCSGSGEANSQGIIGWVKTFNSRFLYQGCKNFMAYLYLPINFFVMPYYAIYTLIQGITPLNQDLGFHWWMIALISFAVMTWFIFVSGLSSRAANIQNWVITSVKFLPLVFAAIIGYVVVATNGGHIEPMPLPDPTKYIPPPLLQQINPVFGVFASIPSIFFAFDGFYATAGIQTEMKEPKKTAMAMSVGLAIVSFIDVAISVSLLIASGTGEISGFQVFLASHNLNWLYTAVQVLIAFGVLGIVNGFAIFNAKFYEDLVINRELPFSDKFHNRTNIHRPWVGTWYSFILSTIFFVVCTTIGIFYFNNGYGFTDKSINGIMSFVDLMANWTSLLAFACIVFAMIGALINRKTNRIKTDRRKSFVPAAYISIVIVGLGLIFVIVQSFANLGLVIHYANSGKYKTPDDKLDNVVGAVLTVFTLLAFVAIMFIPALLKRRNENHKV
ncbi:MAG: APC family permease [Mycoplasmataceae bacterium]|nr:APC family permease [Mycoplasmataceae bacterium]